MDIPSEFRINNTGNILKYTCYVTQIVTVPQSLEIKVFKGVHQSGKRDSDVEGLHCENMNRNVFGVCQGTSMTEFPIGIYKFFPNLTDLTIRNCSLTKITRQVLVGLDDLETLDLSGNALTSLPDDLFINKRSLRSVNFSCNQIKSMTSKLFNPTLQCLTSVYFHNNPDFNEGFTKHQSAGSLRDFLKKIDQKIAPKIKMDVTEEHLHKLGKLLSTGMLSDFVVKVGEKEFKVHNSILAVQSSVFEAMFGSNMEENRSGQLIISDFSISAIEDFLHFLYTGVVKDYINGTELFTLACKYDVADLKDICENIILENVDDTNAMEILNLGHLHCCEKLKQAAFTEIEALVGFDIDESLIDNPQKLQELVDALRKMNSLMDDCRRT